MRRESTQQIVGWIREANITEWNTRIALEPNFNKTAFERRAQQKELRVRGFDTPEAAEEMEERGKTNATPYWDKDPAQLQAVEGLAETGDYAGKRFNGNVIRFPLLNKYENVFQSGVIGNVVLPTFGSAMSDINYSEIAKSITEHLEAKERYNLLFIVEGTEYLSQYKQAIIEAIKAASKTVKSGGIEDITYSIAIYRDINEQQESRRYQDFSASPRLEEAIDFIEKQDFFSWDDNEEYTALNYGLHEGIQNSGINPAIPATNIVFLMGRYGDFTCNSIRKRACGDDPNCKDKYYFKSSQLISQLSDLNAHLFILQTNGSEHDAGACYQKRSKHLIEQTAKRLFDKYTNLEIYLESEEKNLLIDNEKSNITVSPPELVEADGRWEIKNGTSTGHLAAVTKETISKEVINSVRKVKAFNEHFSKQMQEVITEGDMSISSGSLSPQVTELIFRTIQEDNLDAQSMAKFLLSEKYKLYVRCYFPSNIGNEKTSALSPVVMVSGEDLNTYKSFIIDKLRLAIDISSLNEKRRVIQDEVFLEAFKKITGNENLSKSELNESSLIEVHPISSDIASEFGEELKLPKWLFTSSKEVGKMDMKELDEFIDAVLKNSKELIRIRNAGEGHEFAYKTPNWAIDNDPKNLYFWIPVDKMF